MAFNVNFWTFSKKEKSTAQPTGQGTVYSCVSNDPLNLLEPVISLKLALNTASPPTVFNYARIADFGRYYWITGWEIRDGLWWASLRVDVLASWKTDIGNTEAYIFRSSFTYNTYAYDNMYPVLTQQTKHTIALNRICLSAAGMASLNSGFYVVGIISHHGTSYYGFNWSKLQSFIAAIYSDTYISAVLSQYSLQLYPEAKIAVDPTQYISSIRWYPCSWGGPGGSGVIEYGYVEQAIAVGPATVTAEAYNFGEGSLDYSSVQINKQDITITGDAWTHPQQDRGDYLRLSPYSSYQVFFPPFGLFDLDPMEIYKATTLQIYSNIDLKTGMCTLSIKVIYANQEEHTIARTTALIAVDMPLSNIVQVGTTERQYWTNVVSTIPTILGNEASNNFLGVFGSLIDYQKNVVRNNLNGELPHLFQTGGQGNASDLIGDPAIYITYRHIAAEDRDDLGRPVYQIRQIYTIPGYIKCDPDSFSAACTITELNDIKNFMNGGFFYA